MEIEVAGRIIQVIPLDNHMDAFLKILFIKFFTNPNRKYSDFKEENLQDIRTNIHSYLDVKIGNPPGQDYLFNNLTIIWTNYLHQGRVTEAQQFWEDILSIVIDWEQFRKERIHKGSIFYFWSQTAILQGQLDKGFFLIHSAYEEDVLTHKIEKPDTPAYKTVSLNFSDNKNLLFDLVNHWAQYLDQFVYKYRSISGNKLSLKDIHTKFLDNPPSRDTLFSFTYTLARFFEIDSFPPVSIQGNFASIFELNLLFDLVLVIDKLLYCSIPEPDNDDWKFINLANRLLIKAGLSFNSRVNDMHLKNINYVSHVDFEKAMNELLDKRFVYPDHISPSRLECDVNIAYCLRNYSAHKIDSFPIIRKRFTELRQSIFNVFFLAVEFFNA